MTTEHPEAWSDDILARFAKYGQEVAIPDGTALFMPGREGDHFLIARSGSIRVEQTSPSGRSVVLYRVNAGDSCVMTTACMLSGVPYSAYGYAEGDVTALAFDRTTFTRLLADDPDFRSAVFASFSHRIAELTSVIDDLLLNRMDQKLATWLINHADGSGRVFATHQKIAAELGSAREVMSRILKDFEKRGWVALERGAVTILEPDHIAQHAKTTAL